MNDLASSGLLPVPPGHTLRFERFTEWYLPFGRVLSLDNITDVKVLRESATVVPEFARTIDSYLDDYLALFPEPHWRHIFDGPIVIVPVRERHWAAYDLAYLLEILRLYKRVQSFPGARQMLASFRNPTQVAATFFEIETAAWCATRSHTVSLVFGPEIVRNNNVKRPDYLWSTRLGELYCECKLVGEFEDTFRARTERLVGFLENELRAQPEIEGLRYDFVIERTHQAEIAIRALLSQIDPATAKPITISHGKVTLALNVQTAAPPIGATGIRTSRIKASRSPIPLNPQGAQSTITVDATSYWEAVCQRLVREARTQLPLEAPGAIMLGLGLARERAAKAGLAKVQTLIQQPAYGNTPWITIWAQGGAQLVFRNHQPFDARLGEPLGIGA
jgi:hypothetical protein